MFWYSHKLIGFRVGIVGDPFFFFNWIEIDNVDWFILRAAQSTVQVSDDDGLYGRSERQS